MGKAIATTAFLIAFYHIISKGVKNFKIFIRGEV